MFYEFLSDFPIHQQGMYFALGLLSLSLILTGWILFSCRMQAQDPDRDQEDFYDEVSIAKQLEESKRIEQEARDFYSKPSTVRYQISGIERLRILRVQNQIPDEDWDAIIAYFKHADNEKISYRSDLIADVSTEDFKAGAKLHETRKLRIQDRMQVFEKMSQKA